MLIGARPPQSRLNHVSQFRFLAPACPLSVSAHLSHLLSRSAFIWGDHPGAHPGLCLRPPCPPKALAQAQSERQRALCPHAAVAERPQQRGEADGHEADGEERYCPFCHPGTSHSHMRFLDIFPQSWGHRLREAGHHSLDEHQPMRS